MALRPEFPNSGSVDEDHVVYEGEDADVVAAGTESGGSDTMLCPERKVVAEYNGESAEERNSEDEADRKDEDMSQRPQSGNRRGDMPALSHQSDGSMGARPRHGDRKDSNDSDVRVNHLEDQSTGGTPPETVVDATITSADGGQNLSAVRHDENCAEQEGSDQADPTQGSHRDSEEDRGAENHSEEHAAGCTLYVRNLPPHIRTDHVKEHFSQFGDVVDCRIIMNPVTKDSRGFGFVSFATPEIADLAMEKSADVKIDGKTLRIEKARRNRPHDPTPGEYKGPTGASIKYDNCGRLKPGYVPYWHLPFLKGGHGRDSGHNRYHRRSTSRDGGRGGPIRGVSPRRVSSISRQDRGYKSYYDYSPSRGHDNYDEGSGREASYRSGHCYSGGSGSSRGGSMYPHHHAGQRSYDDDRNADDDHRHPPSSRYRDALPYSRDHHRRVPSSRDPVDPNLWERSRGPYDGSARDHRAAPYPSSHRSIRDESYCSAAGDAASPLPSSYYAGGGNVGSSTRNSGVSYDPRRGASRTRSAAVYDGDNSYWGPSVSSSSMGGNARYGGSETDYHHPQHHDAPASHHHHHVPAAASPRSRGPSTDQYGHHHHHQQSSAYGSTTSAPARRPPSASPVGLGGGDRYDHHRRNPKPLGRPKTDEANALYPPPPGERIQPHRASARSRSPPGVRGGGASFICHH